MSDLMASYKLEMMTQETRLPGDVVMIYEPLKNDWAASFSHSV